MPKQEPEQLRPAGMGCQFTPMGMVPLGQAAFEEGMPIAGALPVKEEPQTIPAPVPQSDAAKRALASPEWLASASSAVVSYPRDIVKAAKARIKELRAFLREAKKAEKELKELERLVDAAKRPLAAVRDLRRTAG